MLVSHDMRLIQQVAKEVWECKDGVSPSPRCIVHRSPHYCILPQVIKRLPGSIQDYKLHLKEIMDRQMHKFEEAVKK